MSLVRLIEIIATALVRLMAVEGARDVRQIWGNYLLLACDDALIDFVPVKPADGREA